MRISFAPFWDTLKSRGYTTYTLKYKWKIPGSTYNRLKSDMPISTNTILMLCELLDCEVQDILKVEREK